VNETPVLAIVGPTAAGKTALAVEVARCLPGEVVGTDSMQAYRGMDIGTATPTEDDRAGVSHHMIDCWTMDQDVSVADFQQQARECIDAVLMRGRTPVVTGGSGLYVAAVLDDLRFPGTDPQVRARLESELDVVGAGELHQRLAAVDPEAAEQILATNGRRIVRALEVIEITGGPFTARLPDPVDVYRTVRIGLDIPRDDLDERISQRVDQMWEAGFVDEVRELKARGLGEAPTASRALGYPQVMAFLDGEITEIEARRLTVDATRRFARRQQRWFRRDHRVTWLAYDSPTLVEDVLVLASGGTAT
jgi:tRNA dimethylallyltransferase